MQLKLRFPLRHPLFPGWTVTPVNAVRRCPCTAVSGTYLELMRGALACVTAQRAVFVLLHADAPVLDDSERDELWDAYQVPIFACLLDGDGRLVAFECEAQDGMHVRTAGPEDSAKMAIGGEDSVLGYGIPLDQTVIEKSPCECGRPGHRLRFKIGKPSPRRFEVIHSPLETAFAG